MCNLLESHQLRITQINKIQNQFLYNKITDNQTQSILTKFHNPQSHRFRSNQSGNLRLPLLRVYQSQTVIHSMGTNPYRQVIRLQCRVMQRSEEWPSIRLRWAISRSCNNKFKREIGSNRHRKRGNLHTGPSNPNLKTRFLNLFHLPCPSNNRLQFRKYHSQLRSLKWPILLHLRQLELPLRAQPGRILGAVQSGN